MKFPTSWIIFGSILMWGFPFVVIAAPVEDVLGLDPFLRSLWPLLRWTDWAFVAAGLVFWWQRKVGLLLTCLLLHVLPEAIPNLVNSFFRVPFSRQTIVNISQLKYLLSLSSWLLLAYSVFIAMNDKNDKK